MALGALPINAHQTFNKLWKISDDIWYIAGDKSTDVTTNNIEIYFILV